jgi:hypothetical protein
MRRRGYSHRVARRAASRSLKEKPARRKEGVLTYHPTEAAKAPIKGSSFARRRNPLLADGRRPDLSYCLLPLKRPDDPTCAYRRLSYSLAIAGNPPRALFTASAVYRITLAGRPHCSVRRRSFPGSTRESRLGAIAAGLGHPSYTCFLLRNDNFWGSCSMTITVHEAV